MQKQIIDKKLKFYVIDAFKIAEEVGMGARINIIMQTAFFKISGVLPEEQAIELIKDSIKKTYGKKGEEIVRKNIRGGRARHGPDREGRLPGQAPSATGTSCAPVSPPTRRSSSSDMTGEIIAGRGDSAPGQRSCPTTAPIPTGTTKYEKRNIAEQIPVWLPEVCIQCGDCSAVCPHATIRMKAYDPAAPRQRS